MNDLKKAQAVVNVLRMRVYELEEQLLNDRIELSLQIESLRETIVALESQKV